MATQDERVRQLIALFERVRLSELVEVIVEKVDDEQLESLRTLPYFPSDMLQILEGIGCLRDFIFFGSAMIDWWVPCSIESAKAQNRCPYDPDVRLIKNSEDLLFFAWDCDACLYFYDTKRLPWEIVILDGLSVGDWKFSASDPYEPYKAEGDLIDLLTPWVDCPVR